MVHDAVLIARVLDRFRRSKRLSLPESKLSLGINPTGLWFDKIKVVLGNSSTIVGKPIHSRDARAIP